MRPCSMLFSFDFFSTPKSIPPDSFFVYPSILCIAFRSGPLPGDFPGFRRVRVSPLRLILLGSQVWFAELSYVVVRLLSFSS